MQIVLLLVSFFAAEETEKLKLLNIILKTTNRRQYLNVVNWSLKNSSFTQFVATDGILLLTCWNKILQWTISFLNGISSFLFSLSVGFAPALLVTFCAFTVTVFIILRERNRKIRHEKINLWTSKNYQCYEQKMKVCEYCWCCCNVKMGCLYDLLVLSQLGLRAQFWCRNWDGFRHPLSRGIEIKTLQEFNTRKGAGSGLQIN